MSECDATNVSSNRTDIASRMVRGCLLCSITLACFFCGPAAPAQTPKARVKRVDSPADVVPASAGFFLQLDKLVGDAKPTPSQNASGFFELLVGGFVDPDASAGQWQRHLLDSLGIKSDQAVRELLARKFAIAAPSWEQLGEGVIVVTGAGDEPLISGVFAPHGGESVTKAGEVRTYKTTTGLTVAKKDNLFIAAQSDGKGSMFEQAVRLMRRRRGPSLSTDSTFRRHVATLPPNRNGLMYLHTAVGRGEASPLPFGLSHLTAGLYIDAHHVDLIFRATRAVPAKSSPPFDIERLKRLPQTTVAAWCTQLDIGEAFRTILHRLGTDRAQRLLDALNEVIDTEEIRSQLAGKLGPGAIVTWDQHLGSGPSVPQIAVLLESTEAGACAETLAQALQAVVSWIDVKNRDRQDRGLRFRRSEYLVTTIYELSIPVDTETFGLDSGVVPPLTPAFAPLEDGLVIALSADQIRNIIDARYNLAPQFGEVEDAELFEDHAEQAVMLIVAQPALAARVVDEWLTPPDGPVGLWLSHFRGADLGDPTPGGRRIRLGIGTRPGSQPGTVYVGRVYPDGPAAGLLQSGDRILGLDGRLLSLSNATADLRHHLAQPTPNGHWTFRVQRGERFVDVIVSAAPTGEASPFGTDPATAVRRLQSLFRSVELAVASVTQPDPTTVAARLTFRFSARSQPRP